MAAPSIETVIRRGPWAFAAIALPVVGFAASSLLETVTEEEKEEQKNEAKRRSGILEDMIKNLQDGSDADEAKEDGDSCVEDDAGNDYDDIGQIEFEVLREKCMELAEVESGAPVLKAGVEWCGKLLLKELERATAKTQAQKDVRYSDGKKLESLLDSPVHLDQLARVSGFKVPSELRSNIKVACRRGYYVRRYQKWRDILKAIKMVFIARETLPWLVASNAMSTVATGINTMALHYRAEVLQALKVPDSRDPFYRATRAMVLIELLAGMSRTLEGQLAARVDRIMAKSLQVKLFNALLTKDIVWWGEQKDAYQYAWMVLGLPDEVKNALEVPRNLINTLTSVCIQAALVRAKSNRMLQIIIGLHWAHFFLRKGLQLVQDVCNRRATAGLVCSAQSEMTWCEAINPQYVQLFQSFCRGPLETKLLIKYTVSGNRLKELQSAVTAGFSPLHSLLSQSRSIVEFLSMGGLLKRSNMDITDAQTTLDYAQSVGDSIESSYASLGAIQDQFGELARAYDLITIPAKFDPCVGHDPGVRSAGCFVFDDVTFAYPGKKASILKGVSFEVKPGQAVGITGESGCGKSTLLKLVERFHDVTAGCIRLDGRDIREYQPQWLRSQIVTVSQEPKLIPASIRENLTFGCQREPSIEQIEQACRSANIWDVLKDPQKFPNGLETEMSVIENISGGEKQRICIARAILADPPILLLDEATSALDEVSQACVQEALNKLMKGRTTLVIAHRLSAIKDSDKIVCLKDGKVVDDGTHEELIAKSPPGLYRTLWVHAQTAVDDGSTAAAQVLESRELPPKSKMVMKENVAVPCARPRSLQRSLSVPRPRRWSQRKAGSLTALCDVLRQALASSAEIEETEQRRKGVRHLQELLDDLEVQVQDFSDVGHAKQFTPSASLWHKLRCLQKRGIVRSTSSDISAPLLERAVSGPSVSLDHRNLDTRSMDDISPHIKESDPRSSAPFMSATSESPM